MDSPWTFEQAIEHHRQQMSRPAGYWVDMGSYWKWVGGPRGYFEPPCAQQQMQAE